MFLFQQQETTRKTELSTKIVLNCADQNIVNETDQNHKKYDVLLGECGTKENQSDDVKDWEEKNNKVNNSSKYLKM